MRVIDGCPRTAGLRSSAPRTACGRPGRDGRTLRAPRLPGIEVVRSLLEDNDLPQAALVGPVFASRSVVSEILSGKRKLTLDRSRLPRQLLVRGWLPSSRRECRARGRVRRGPGGAVSIPARLSARQSARRRVDAQLVGICPLSSYGLCGVTGPSLKSSTWIPARVARSMAALSALVEESCILNSEFKLCL